jgi:hypothetical protein
MLKRISAVAVLAIGASVAGLLVSPAAWGQTVCTGPLRNTTVAGPVIVPEGANCSITGSTVTGPIYVSPGGRLSVVNSTVQGVIYAERPQLVNLENATVEGTVAVEGLDEFGVIGICNSTIGGDVIVQNATTELFIAIGPSCDPEGGNDIAGDVIVQNNVTNQDPEFPIPPLRVANNTIGGRLYCVGNSPPATAENNTAQGGAFGECAAGAAT